MTRINFAVVSNPRDINVPAFAVADEFTAASDQVAEAIARKNRGVAKGVYETGRAADKSYRDFAVTVCANSGAILGDVTFRIYA